MQKYSFCTPPEIFDLLILHRPGMGGCGAYAAGPYRNQITPHFYPDNALF